MYCTFCLGKTQPKYKSEDNMNWNYESGRIYSVDEKDELMAEATYVAGADGTVDIDHTFVNPVLRGQGVAGQMMEVVAAYLRENGLKATASCSYANAWLKKHRDSYPGVVSDEIDTQAAACKIDGRH